MCSMSILPFRALAIAVFTSLLAVHAAVAGLQFKTQSGDNGLDIILVQGEFSFDDDLDAFSAEVRAHPRAVVTFNSPGGNIIKAMELGRLIRSYGLSTIQIRDLTCESACSLAFMGGVTREAEPGSIGVHRSSFAPDSGLAPEDQVAAVQQMTAETISYMAEMGVDASLVQLALQYDSKDIRYLSGSEMAKYRVTTGTGQPAAAATPGSDGVSTPGSNTTAPPAAATALPPDLRDQAIGFIEQLIEAHTRDAHFALDQVTRSYGPTIDYYGRQLSLADVLKDKDAYFRRWPERRYRVRPPSISAACAGSVCAVTGTYDWWVRSIARARQASGTASFRYVLDVGDGSGRDFRVIEESGQVLSR